MRDARSTLAAGSPPRPSHTLTLETGEVDTIRRPIDLGTEKTYGRVITCQPYADYSCHKLKANGAPNYRLRYGPVTVVNPRFVAPQLKNTSARSGDH